MAKKVTEKSPCLRIAEEIERMESVETAVNRELQEGTVSAEYASTRMKETRLGLMSLVGQLLLDPAMANQASIAKSLRSIARSMKRQTEIAERMAGGR